MTWQEKTQEIVASIRQKKGLVVALSGGLDSSVVSALAHQALGKRSLAVTIDSPLTCSGDLHDAVRVAEFIGIEHLIVRLNELEFPEFRSNPVERCYLCKHHRFERLLSLARERGYQAVADGTNRDDGKEFRPGLRAAKKLGVYSPLVEAGLSKPEVLAIAESLGLPVARKPHNSCLATRIPYGEELSAARLERIDTAETYLRSLAPFKQLRLRDHGHLARLELDQEGISYLMDESISHKVVKKLRELGYNFVTLDLEGYRFGSFDK
jgi:pyridinium-3,5-biscarboxylic acid mononucleotide sulfurtransferase